MALCVSYRRGNLLDALSNVRRKIRFIRERRQESQLPSPLGGEGKDGGSNKAHFPHLSPPPQGGRRTRIALFVVWFLASGFWLLSFGRPAFACPGCKEAIAKMGEIWTAVGFNWSIYLMISVPFLLVASFGGVLYIHYRRHHPPPR